MERTPKVVNEADLEWSEMGHGSKFGQRRKRMGVAVGGEKLGCSLYEVPPGRAAFPYHYHHANEEAVYVLAGSGTLRIGEEEVEVSAGDYAAFPTGEGYAHQLINTSEDPLRYLCFSTMIEPEVGFYPDSGKYVVFAASTRGGSEEKKAQSKFLRADAEVDYWWGET